MLLPSSDFFSEIDAPSSDTTYVPSPIKLRSTTQMQSLSIPPFLQEAYLLGRPPPEIRSLRPWQVELFSKPEWKERKNCLICVATAGGKTVAAEVAIAQLLQSDPDARILYCLPFVSLAAEKYSDFGSRFSSFSVKPFYANIGTSEFANGSIAICTFEKAHTLINAAIRNKYIDKFKLIIIDEIHMLGDSHRGATVEALVAKLKLLKKCPQIIGLSATINSTDAMAYGKWLGGFVYSNYDRPSIIRQYVVTQDGSLSRIDKGTIGKRFRVVNTIKEDKNHFLPLIADAIGGNNNSSSNNNINDIILNEFEKQASVLIFVNSRRETREYAMFIAKNLFSDEFSKISKLQQPSQIIMKARKNLLLRINHSRFSNDDAMSFCLMRGVAFHNAGLLLDERKFIEDALRNGVINIIVATTTLSAGINITNVSTIIIQNVFRKEGEGRIPLTGAQYNQMAGRAGRTGQKNGTVIILQQNMDEKETFLIQELSKFNVGHITGHLLEKSEFDRFYLQCLTFFNEGESYRLPNQTYEAVAQNIKEVTLEGMRLDAVDRLVEKKIILNEEKVTKLGKAIAGANFGIEEGLQVYENLTKAQLDVCFCDELHLLYLVIPTDIGFKTPPYKDDVWTRYLFNEHPHVINEMLKLSSDELNKRVTLSYVQGGLKSNDEVDKMLDKIYSAAILLEVINEKPVAVVEKMFNVDRGTIQSLQTNVSTFAGQVVKFCELCSFQFLGAAINKFRKRLDYSVKNELLSLMSLPSCSQSMARMLFNQGIESPIDLVNMQPSEVIPILKMTEFVNLREVGRQTSVDIAELVEKIKIEAVKTVENQRKLDEFSENIGQMRLDYFF